MSSFGEELRRERELRKFSLREISEATKISLRYLDALERNDFRHLPGGVFNRGFVRAYAQFIGVDPEVMVNAYLLEERGQETKRREAGGAPGAASVPAAPRPGARGRGKLWLAVSGLLLLVAAGVFLGFLALRYWRSQAREPGRSDTGSSASRPAAARSAPGAPGGAGS